MRMTRTIPDAYLKVLGASSSPSPCLAALSYPLTTTDHDFHHDVYSHIWFPWFSYLNNPIQDQGTPGGVRATTGGDLVRVQTAPCSLPSWHRNCRFCDGLFLFFFFQKSTIEVLFTWSDSFPPFCSPYPLPAGNLENAKKLKVPHAESSLDVLGVWPWVHDCAYHKRNCPFHLSRF